MKYGGDSEMLYNKISSDFRLYLQALTGALPSLFLLLYFLYTSHWDLPGKLLISGLIILWVLVSARKIRRTFLSHIHTLSNLIEAIRAEDYSLRAGRAREPGDLGELYQQINALTAELQTGQTKEQELRKLLEKVVARINVAIVASDYCGRIQLVNPMAARLLDTPTEALIGKQIDSTVLVSLPVEPVTEAVAFTFPGSSGRWQVTQQAYWERSRPGKLLFIADLDQVLREQEIDAWQRLIRVIAHEVNNSLTPIVSLSHTLRSQVIDNSNVAGDKKMLLSLDVIGERAAGLREFIAEYARIARLPEPQKRPFSVQSMLCRVQSFFSDERIKLIEPSPAISLFGDPVLIEQLMINLVKNALEASASQTTPVEIHCQQKQRCLEVRVLDEGRGITNPNNLFVPFYSTKPKGAGIGLALCRKVVYAHQGHLTLKNREDRAGAMAVLQLPIVSN